MPRLRGDGPALLYVRDFFATVIWETQNFDRNAGGPIGTPVDDPDLTESGPVVPTFAMQGQLAAYKWFFDRNVSKTDKRRELFGAAIDTDGGATTISRLPAPFNAMAPTSQFSFALARERAWWMVNLDGMLNTYLVTAPLQQGAKSAVVSINLPPGCPLHEFDAVPWVTPDGAMLLVTALQRDASCSSPDQRTDIFRVRLDPTGQPLQTAGLIQGIDQPTSGETDASLSADLCWLYFASDRTADKRFRLFRSHRGR